MITKSGKLDVRHDNFRETPQHVFLFGTNSWMGWTCFELSSDRDRSLAEKLHVNDDTKMGELKKTVSGIPSVRQEGQAATRESRILCDTQRFMHAGYLVGPNPKRGPPEVVIRKRVIVDADTGTMIADENYERTYDI